MSNPHAVMRSYRRDDEVKERKLADGTFAAYDALAQGQTQTITVAYGVTDGIATTPASVQFTITGTNDAPIVTGAVLGSATLVQLNAPSVFNFYSPLTRVPGSPQYIGPEFQIYAPSLAIGRANFLYELLSGEYKSMIAIDIAPFVISRFSSR